MPGKQGEDVKQLSGRERRVDNAKVDNANCYNLIKADPKFTHIEINGKLVPVEVDTVTLYTVVSEKSMESYFKNCKIEEAGTNLVNYEQNPMKPLGQLKNLKVELKEKKNKNLNCFVLRGELPLIGRQ